MILRIEIPQELIRQDAEIVIKVSNRNNALGYVIENGSKQYYEYLIELMDAKAYVNVNKLTDYYYDMAYEGKWHETLNFLKMSR